VQLKITAGGNKQGALSGELNGGGPLLSFHAHGGYVEINPPRI
jgi:hypothetical protein